ncbi:MAG: hypothetical protein FWG44_05325 [Oscillospiraceae bacterium]|nr:hypothetical protein [Oscillospiraceae bacterium]
MIKRIFGVFTAIILAVIFVIPVYADVVWSNEFLDKNYKKAVSVNETFTVNSPDGFVIPTEEPGGSVKDRRTIENGTIVYIEAVYFHKGAWWGIDQWGSHYSSDYGWFLMDNLLLTYTNEDFEKENKKRFIHRNTNDYDDIFENERLVLWQWPGSDREKTIHNIDIHIEVLKTYRDDDEREWGFIEYPQYITGYYYTAWICLSDPENKTNIPSFNPAPEPWAWTPPNKGSAQTYNNPEGDTADVKNPAVIVGITGGIAAAVAAIAGIALFSGKKRKP